MVSPRTKQDAKPPAKRAPRKKPGTKSAPPPLVGEEQLLAIFAAVELGMEPERAARAQGVAADVWTLACKDPALQSMLEQVLAKCELNALRMLHARVDGWQAFRWLLERKYPERYGFKQSVIRPPRGADDGDDGEGAEVIPETRMERLRREREERARAASRHA